MAIGDDVAGYKDVATGGRDVPPPGPDSARISSPAMPELKSLLGIAVGVVAIAGLYFGKDVLIPITLAVMLSFVLSPLVDLLQRLKLWRAPAVILTVLAALGIIGLIGTLIGSQAAALTADAPRYAQTVEAKIESVQGFAIARIGALTREFGAPRAKPAGPVASSPPKALTAAPADAAGAERRPVLVQMAPQQASPFTIARTILAPILGPLETTVIVLIVAIFVLMQKDDLRDRFIRVFGSSDLHRTTLALDDAGQRLSRYFLSQLAVNTGFGVVIGLGLWAIGIPSSAMWGILAGLLRFVPYIGSFLAAIAPIALGAAIDPGWSMALYVALLFVLVEPLTGYVVEPLLYGHSTGLSPVSVIVSAIFWTWLWGPIGLIMSTPLTLCLVVMGRHVKSLEFFDVLLGDRPALTPVESFYQRILADNEDEALAQAELLLADRPLVDYYDAVVLGALRLAADDEARGMIDHARSADMLRSIGSVIDDLRDHDDAISATGQGAPPAVSTAGAVACIAGRGPFDATALAMAMQLLGRRGIAVRQVSRAAVSRDAIDMLDLGDATVVLLLYLDLTGTPAQLRYLIRRLRRHAPKVRIIVGLWRDGEAALSNGEVQRAVGADLYVRSLRETTDAIAALPLV